MKKEKRVSVTFYLKPVSRNKDNPRRSVYITIAFKGQVAKTSTGIFCEDQKQWSRGMFVGKGVDEQNRELLGIRYEIESYDSSMFRDAEQIKNVWNGAEHTNYPNTILEALEYGFEEKGKATKSGTMKMRRTAINNFEKFKIEKNYPNFGVVKGHPQQINELIITSYYDWLLKNGTMKSTANGYVNGLKTLYSKYYKKHYSVIDHLLNNPFNDIIQKDKKTLVVAHALSRTVDWKWVEEIEKVKILDPNKEELRLVTLLLAYSGLSFIDLAKSNVLEITETLDGPIIVGQRVKTGKPYIIPVTSDLKRIINKLNGRIPWKSFVDSEGNYNIPEREFYANRFRQFLYWLTKEIGCDVKLSAHRFRHAYGMRAVNHYRLPIDIVARMLGDTEQTIRENYCDLVTTTVMSMYNEAMSLFDQKKNPSKGGKRDAIGNK
jgi:integrase